VDGSGGFDEPLLGCLELSDSVFLMMTGEFLAVRNAQHYLAALGRMGFTPEQIKIVVNRHRKNAQSVSAEQIQQTLGARVYYTLPNRYAECMQALHQARPAVIYSGDLQQAFLAFTKKVLGAAENGNHLGPVIAEKKKFLGIL
jgi:MinD-like ATPase involved in chromosome partitioning or flagellar assembly